MGRPREFDNTAVVDAAMAVFWVKGYAGASTEELCVSTGLGRGSLYNAFGSKQELYEEVLRRYAELAFREQLLILRAPGSVRDRLRALMTWVVDTDLADPGRRGCLAINAAVEPSGRDAAVTEVTQRQFAGLEKALTKVMAEGQRAGEISADRSPEQVARCFQSAYYGLRVLGKVSKDRAALLDVIEGTLAAL